jgi:hypothetical protein
MRKGAFNTEEKSAEMLFKNKLLLSPSLLSVQHASAEKVQ